jgi:hypothetical protein
MQSPVEPGLCRILTLEFSGEPGSRSGLANID